VSIESKKTVCFFFQKIVRQTASRQSVYKSYSIGKRFNVNTMELSQHYSEENT